MCREKQTLYSRAIVHSTVFSPAILQYLYREDVMILIPACAKSLNSSRIITQAR